MARGVKLTTVEFITQSKLVHGDKYDYSLVQYKNTHTKVIIICPIHGNFSQVPMDHKKGCGCDKCSGTFVHTQETIVQKFKDVHKDLYDYSKVVYKNIDTKVILGCKIHGEFKITPKCVIQQYQGCRKCGYESNADAKRTTLDEFIIKSTNVHGTKYDYSLSVYKNNHTKVDIICPEHGLFSQTPDAHINQHQGCPQCGNLLKGGLGGYTHEYFKNNPEEQNKPGILYTAHIINGLESFFKIGITSKTTKQRFGRTEYKDMDIVVLHELHTTMYAAFCEEQRLLNDLKSHRFFSNTQFSGCTEIFHDNATVAYAIHSAFV